MKGSKIPVAAASSRTAVTTATTATVTVTVTTTVTTHTRRTCVPPTVSAAALDPGGLNCIERKKKIRRE